VLMIVVSKATSRSRPDEVTLTKYFAR
jgi:hypothetical protein